MKIVEKEPTLVLGAGGGGGRRRGEKGGVFSKWALPKFRSLCNGEGKAALGGGCSPHCAEPGPISPDYKKSATAHRHEDSVSLRANDLFKPLAYTLT